jgi:hypothetical protein
LSKNLIVKTGQNRTGKLVFASSASHGQKAPAGDARFIDPNQSLGMDNAASFLT